MHTFSLVISLILSWITLVMLYDSKATKGKDFDAKAAIACVTILLAVVFGFAALGTDPTITRWC